jgi:hypothetical protein
VFCEPNYQAFSLYELSKPSDLKFLSLPTLFIGYLSLLVILASVPCRWIKAKVVEGKGLSEKGQSHQEEVVESFRSQKEALGFCPKNGPGYFHSSKSD